MHQLRDQIRALDNARTALSNEVSQLKAQLRSRAVGARPDAKETFITIPGSAMVLGNPDAPVTLVEFADFECAFCRQHFQETFPRIKEEYVDTGKVRYVFCDFPLSSVHGDALPAAEAVRCAAEQGKFWPMHDRLMGSTALLDEESLTAHAAALGLDLAGFHDCLASRKHGALIQEELAEGMKAGIKGTPTFLVAIGEPNARRVKVERTLKGAPPFSFFKQQIDELLGH